MTTASDSSILFDILLEADPFAAASMQALTQAVAQGPTVVSPIVYAELAAYFDAPAELDEFLGAVGVRVDDLSEAALFAAGRAWLAYNAARPRQLACAACGQFFALACPTCAAEYRPRQHVLVDFLIGAHAKERANRLLTRDEGYFRRYFPDLEILVPYVR